MFPYSNILKNKIFRIKLNNWTNQSGGLAEYSKMQKFKVHDKIIFGTN